MIIKKAYNLINKYNEKLTNKNPSSVLPIANYPQQQSKNEQHSRWYHQHSNPHNKHSRIIISKVDQNLSIRTKGSKNEDNDLQSQSSVYNYNGNNGNNFNANV